MGCVCYMVAPMRWAGIVRVSFVGGRGGEAFHADRDQIRALTVEAERRDVELEILEPEMDISGGLPIAQRPSLLQAVEGVERGEYAGIMVAYLSRLGRSVREQLAVWDRVEAAGGRIVVVQEGIDTSTPAGKFQRTVLLAVAEMELDMHAERFENLREWATAAGIWQRRQTPTGYSRDPRTRKLVPDERAKAVERAFADRAAGGSIMGIARHLKMTPSGARQLLKNRVYLGELRVGKHVNPAAHPPLVSEAVFLAAQAGMTSRPARSTRPVALLAGLVRCASCGHVMSRGRGVYTCARRHSAGDCPRPASITIDKADAHVTRIAIAELRKIRQIPEGKEAQLEGAVADAKAELAAYLEGVLAAGLSPNEFADGARSRREAVQKAQSALARAQTLRPVRGNREAIWKALDPEQRNRFLRSLVDLVVVTPAGRGKNLPPGERMQVLAHGSGLVPNYSGGGEAMPLQPIVIDNTHPALLGVDLTE